MQRNFDENAVRYAHLTTARCRTSLIEASDVDDRLVSDWTDLVSRAAESNAFLAPSFVLPATQFLHKANDVFLVTVRSEGGQLIGLSVFERMPASRNVPFAHVRALKTMHSFRSGLLIDSQQLLTGLDGILGCLASQGIWGIDFDEQWLDSPLVRAFRIVCDHSKYHWAEASEYDRPVFRPATIGASDLSSCWSKNRRKAHKKNLRRLDALGAWELRVVRQGSDFERAIERFIKLEHSGWKGDQGSSLRSNPNEEQFFSTMMRGFTEENASFFVELTSKGRVIGSTANLTAGQTAFAFKVGWDAEYAHVSPGKVLDAELMIRSQELLPKTQLVDSCAKGECYLAGLWPDRIRIGRGVMTLKRRSRLISTVVDQGRYAKRHLVGTLAGS